MDLERGRNDHLGNRSGTHSEEFTSELEEFMSDSESKSYNERINMMLFEKNPVEVNFSLRNETVQPLVKACTVNINDEDNPNVQSQDEENRYASSSSQDVRNLQRTPEYLRNQRRAGESVF